MKVGDMVQRKNSPLALRVASRGIIISKMIVPSTTTAYVEVFYPKNGKIYSIAESLVEKIIS